VIEIEKEKEKEKEKQGMYPPHKSRDMRVVFIILYNCSPD